MHKVLNPAELELASRQLFTEGQELPLVITKLFVELTTRLAKCEERLDALDKRRRW